VQFHARGQEAKNKGQAKAGGTRADEGYAVWHSADSFKRNELKAPARQLENNKRQPQNGRNQ
jgi:hypothetical protein